MKKKKILMILHIPPPVHGAAMMGKYLVESKPINDAFEVDCINLSTSETLDEVGKKGFNKIRAAFRVSARVISALRKNKYDLVYMTLTSSSTGFYKDLAIVSILKSFRQNIIYHLHNKGVSSFQNRWLDNRFYRYTFRNTRSILLSPLLYPDIQKYVPLKNVSYCPNGIPAGEKNSIIDRTGKKVPEILFLSHMMVEKGVVVLLDACKILQQKGVEFKCNFVGAWSNITETQFSEMVSSRKLEKNVIYHGPKFGADKQEFFNNADIFVLPTYYKSECFSLVLLEAMSYGLPIISTNEGAIPDIIENGKTGFVIDRKNSEQLADQLEILVKNEQLRTTFGEAGFKRFNQYFTIDKFEKNMAEILSHTVSQPV